MLYEVITYLSALGSHRELGEKNTLELLEPAKFILSILKEAKVPMPAELTEKKQELQDLVNQLREKQLTPETKIPIQQLRVLTNIAELSLKLVDRAQPFELVKQP